MAERKTQQKTPQVGGSSARMSAGIKQRAKIHAAKTGTTLQAIIDDAVEEYLKKRGA